MIPWIEIDRAEVPGEKNELILRQRGDEFSIQIAGTELMNSRAHGSEEALASLVMARVSQKADQRILIGGLGMGFTLAQALELSKPNTKILVAELIPKMISWNSHHLGDLAGKPLEDPRVSTELADVADVIQREKAAWDAILLDVDNGPAGLTRESNNRLYNRAGLRATFEALVPGGGLGVWSAENDPVFTRSLKQCGFSAKAVPVRARSNGKGGRHTIWVAQKPI